MDIERIDFNDIPLKDMRIHENDKIVFKHVSQADLAYLQCEDINGQPVITVFPTMNTQRIFVTDVAYVKNSFTLSV